MRQHSEPELDPADVHCSKVLGSRIGQVAHFGSPRPYCSDDFEVIRRYSCGRARKAKFGGPRTGIDARTGLPAPHNTRGSPNPRDKGTPTTGPQTGIDLRDNDPEHAGIARQQRQTFDGRLRRDPPLQTGQPTPAWAGVDRHDQTTTRPRPGRESTARPRLQ